MTKPQFQEGYDDQVTRDCERVLVTLLRGLGPLKSSVYLVGGLTPRYLVKARPPEVPPHAGTGDLDVVVDMTILADTEAYATLEKNLKRMGFERAEAEHDINKKVSWRWKAKIDGGTTIILEFLAYDPEKAGGRITEIKTAGNVTAMNIPHADIVFDLNDQERVTAQLLNDGGEVTETIFHANRVSFTCLKSFAFDHRYEPKDAHDIVYCLEHGRGGVEAAIAEFEAAAGGRHREVITTSLKLLADRFGDDDRTEGYRKDGPVAVAMFEMGDDPEPEAVERRALRQREVADLVGRLLEGLAPLLKPPAPDGPTG